MPSQNVEKIGWGGHVADLHIAILMLTIELVRRREDSRVFVAELEIAFHPARRMLRPLSIVTVRQRHDQSRPLKPLDLARSNKLVNDALTVVGKVAKLSFPHDKGRW